MQEDKNTEQEKPSLSAIDRLLNWVNNSVEFFQTAWYRINHVEQANMELGMRHMREKNYFDAALRFKYACWKNKNNMIAHYMQGKAYTYAGRYDKAIAPLRIALADNPKLEEAKFLLACCGQDVQIERVPPSLLIEHLDMIADLYDGDIADKKNLKVTNALREEFDKYYEDKQGFDVLDLDCRTGESATTILSRANYLVGVDPSLKMISKARDKRDNDRLIYNQLITKMPIDYLKNLDRQFDVVITLFSFFNYGNLSENFSFTERALKSGGIFAFNIVATNGEAYIFDHNEISFKHSNAYIIKLAEENNMEVIATQPIEFQNGGNEILFLLKKK